MTRRTIFAAALVLATSVSGPARAGWFHGPWDPSLGTYNGYPMWSYNEAYTYQLPFGGYQLYNPFNPFENPGRGAYYPRDSYFWWPPYGQQLYSGPRLFNFHARAADPPPPAEAAFPALQPVPGPGGNEVVVAVRVPDGAEVWFDGEKTAQSGPERLFHSPPLRPGAGYVYVVRAKWKEAGHEVEQMQTVSVHAAERVLVAFPVARP